MKKRFLLCATYSKPYATSFRFKNFYHVEYCPTRSHDRFLYDFVDGDIFINHPLYSMKPNALQIILYTDKIEICNPLSFYASHKKLLMVY